MAELVKKSVVPLRKMINYFASLIRKHGWKAAIGIFLFYLVRDVTLYIILPFFIAKSVFF